MQVERIAKSATSGGRGEGGSSSALGLSARRKMGTRKARPQRPKRALHAQASRPPNSAAWELDRRLMCK